MYEMDAEKKPVEESAFGQLTVEPRQPTLPDEGGRMCIGKVGAPQGQEATSREFYFWIPDDCLVEVSQIVTVESPLRKASTGEEIPLRFHAIVDEVFRTSRRKGMGHEWDEADGDVTSEPPFAAEGLTYAQASILNIKPNNQTPPRERSRVLLATNAEAQAAYGADTFEDHGLAVGLIKNGGDITAGPGSIDLDYLLGENGGHLNVTGTAGLGTKSSFLLSVVYLLLQKARLDAETRPSDPGRLRIVPIIFNVKNYDLFHIDRMSTRYQADKHGAGWEEMGITDPGPFTDVSFFAPQQIGSSSIAISETGRGSDVKPYSWSLADVVTQGLLTYLFSEEDAQNDNFAALLLDLESLLTKEEPNKDGTISRTFSSQIDSRNISNFQQLLEWLRNPDLGAAFFSGRSHSKATVLKLSRRLIRLLYDSRGILRLTDNGNPLQVTRSDTRGPIVIDLNALSGATGLQKFVIGAVLQQLVQARTGGRAIKGMKYLVVLDELNRFAPAGGRDPITKLIETVAAEMRSQGVLLFGAQQQASLVSKRVIENAATKAIGQTGSQELDTSVWSGLSRAVKRKAESLTREEKLILQSGFRQPLHIKVPRPVWAMNPNEAGQSPSDTASDDFIAGLIGN